MTDLGNRTLSKRLIVAVLLLEAGHVVTTAVGIHANFWSNVFQLAMALLTVLVCLREWRQASSVVAQRCWMYVSLAFLVWSLAQAVFLHDMYLPPFEWRGRTIDDALWLLVGLPQLIAVYPKLQDADAVGWLDKVQIGVTFSGLYVLVFAASGELSVPTAYALQNVLLAACCFIRVSAETCDRERRAFVQLAIFLGVYTFSSVCANLLFSRGWKEGTPLDAVWTFPLGIFCILVLRDSVLPQERRPRWKRGERSLGHLHSLSIGILPVVAIVTSVDMAHHRPRLGGFFLSLAVLTFLLRVAKRETSWQVAHRTLEDAVLKDVLTGLGNRALLRKQLQVAREHEDEGNRVVLIFADLDKFKAVNDTLGHELGDKLLIQVGERLLEAAPAASTVCRLGGDEFVVLTRAGDPQAAEAIGNRLLEAIRLPMQLGRHTVRCTASIGVVLADGREGREDLLRTADLAMYQAKQNGKNRVMLFTEAWQQTAKVRWKLEADLRRLLNDQEIGVAFQPIIDLDTAVIRGFEALARWHHPVYGHVSPAEFISMAEDLGLIGELGAQVLQVACAQLASWNRKWGTSLCVSVNISPQQLADGSLVQGIAATLERTGLDPACLKLEITESALLVGMADVKRVLHQIRQLGIKISLDDFGTGYSSLSFLLNLPVDEIKVDRSFVSNMQQAPEKRQIVQQMIQLGQGLKKVIVAEGAETAEDVQELLTLRCPRVQGWIFCRPQQASWMEENFDRLGQQVARQIEEFRVAQKDAQRRAETADVALLEDGGRRELVEGAAPSAYGVELVGQAR